MYAHQVMTDLDVIVNNCAGLGPDYKAYLNAINLLLNALPSSHQFHIDSVEAIEAPLNINYTAPLFLEKRHYLKIPYHSIWLDYIYDIETPIRNDSIRVTKRGLFVLNLGFKDLYYIHVFVFHPDEKTWVPSIISHIFLFGGRIKDRPEIKNTPLFRRFSGDGNSTYVPLHPEVLKHPGLVERIRSEDGSDLRVLQYFLKWLHCKNIVQVEIPAPAALNKKRRRKNRQELFSYHVLRIKPTKAEKANGKPYQGGLNRIHFCRGHFKEYTKENPLFGRFTGLYWWQSHVRGRNKKGIVMKDYRC